MDEKSFWHTDTEGGEINKWLHSGPVLFNTVIPASAIVLGVLNALSFFARKKIEGELANEKVRLQAVNLRLANLRGRTRVRNPPPAIPVEKDERGKKPIEVRGKSVNTALYLHVSALKYRPEIFEVAILAQGAIEENHGSITYNVVKIWPRKDTITLLDYPRFFEDGVPSLFESWTYNLKTGRSSRNSQYDPDENPPVLHRKELLLHPKHKAYKRAATLSHELHEARLLTGSRIGNRVGWEQSLERAGYRLEGMELVKASEAVPVEGRARTAIARTEASAPLRWALSKDLVTSPAIDWGCGRGADVAEMRARGVRAVGYDPVWAPKVPRGSVYSYGQLVYVLNVIETPKERAQALHELWRRVRAGGTALIAVRSRRAVQDAASRGRWVIEGDGWRTSSGTFQHGFTQDELESMLVRKFEISNIFKRYGSIIAVGTRKRIAG